MRRGKTRIQTKAGTKAESDVANAVIDIMNINKLPSGMEQLAADLDDIDYVTTRRQKRKLDKEGENMTMRVKMKKINHQTRPRGLMLTYERIHLLFDLI